MSRPSLLQRFLQASWQARIYALRYRIKRAWSRVFPRVPLPVRLPYGGWWLAADDMMDDSIFTGNFERNELKFVENFLKPGMTVLDIGAHHGLYTILAAQKVGKGGKVFAFEPSPNQRRRLATHLRLNRVADRVSILPAAVGNETAGTTLYVVAGKETGCNSLRPPAVQEPTEPVQVQVTSLDAILSKENMGRVDFIKMDIEGAELAALQGARELLAKHPRPVILAEMADSRTLAWGYQASAIYDFLAARGFQWFEVKQDGTLRAHARTAASDGNLVAFPDERVNTV
jgi:FkbM family methyltransferase